MINETAKTYGDFIVVKLSKKKRENCNIYWVCKCKICGVESDIKGTNLRRGISWNCRKCSKNQYTFYDLHVTGKTKKGEDFIIDIDDYNKISKISWCKNKHGYLKNTKTGLMHRYILNMESDMVVDHINRNPSDNRKSNLRICTQQQNSWNSNNKGYYWCNKKKRWVAEIKKNRKKIYIGSFKNEDEAREAYLLKKKELFGEYAGI